MSIVDVYMKDFTPKIPRDFRMHPEFLGLSVVLVQSGGRLVHLWWSRLCNYHTAQYYSSSNPFQFGNKPCYATHIYSLAFLWKHFFFGVYYYTCIYYPLQVVYLLILNWFIHRTIVSYAGAAYSFQFLILLIFYHYSRIYWAVILTMVHLGSSTPLRLRLYWLSELGKFWWPRHLIGNVLASDVVLRMSSLDWTILGAL